MKHQHCAILAVILLGVLPANQMTAGPCLKTAAAICRQGGTVNSTPCPPGSAVPNATVVDTHGVKSDCVVPGQAQGGYDKQEYHMGTCNWVRITTDCNGVKTYTAMSSPVQECIIAPDASSCVPPYGG